MPTLTNGAVPSSCSGCSLPSISPWTPIGCSGGSTEDRVSIIKPYPPSTTVSICPDTLVVDCANKRVGINTATPTETLTVNGDASITGNVYMDPNLATSYATSFSTLQRTISCESNTYTYFDNAPLTVIFGTNDLFTFRTTSTLTDFTINGPEIICNNPSTYQICFECIFMKEVPDSIVTADIFVMINDVPQFSIYSENIAVDSYEQTKVYARGWKQLNLNDRIQVGIYLTQTTDDETIDTYESMRIRDLYLTCVRKPFTQVAVDVGSVLLQNQVTMKGQVNMLRDSLPGGSFVCNLPAELNESLRVGDNLIFADAFLDTVSFGIGKTRILTVDTQNQRVGILKENPQATMDIDGEILVNGSMRAGQLFFVDVPNNIIDISAPSALTRLFATTRSFPPKTLLVDAANNRVGVGVTDAPQRTLDVEGDAIVRGAFWADTYENLPATPLDPASLVPIYLDKTNGRVGINQPTPVSPLDVTGNVHVSGTVDAGNVAAQNSLLVGGAATIGGDAFVHHKLTANTIEGTNWIGYPSPDLAPITLDQTNNRVGVNQANPAFALDVTGDVHATGTVEANNLTAQSNLAVAGTATMNNATVLTKVTTGTIEATNWIGLPPTDLLPITLDKTNNRVGINVTTPTEALDVTGNIKSSSKVIMTANSINIGSNNGVTNQGLNAVSIGKSAGTTNQSSGAVAVGNLAGNSDQGSNSIAIGNTAGQTSQLYGSVSVGYNAGKTNQAQNAVAIGSAAGAVSQGHSSVLIGSSAGVNGCGVRSIGIGNNAGYTVLDASCIVLTADDGVRSTTGTSRTFISPIRSVAHPEILTYDPTTKEVGRSTLLPITLDKTNNRVGIAFASPSNTLDVGGTIGSTSFITSSLGMFPGGSSGAVVKSGTGDPEGQKVGTVGSLYLRTDGASGTTLYTKETGTGNTGWISTTKSRNQMCITGSISAVTNTTQKFAFQNTNGNAGDIGTTVTASNIDNTGLGISYNITNRTFTFSRRSKYAITLWVTVGDGSVDESNMTMSAEIGNADTTQAVLCKAALTPKGFGVMSFTAQLNVTFGELFLWMRPSFAQTRTLNYQLSINEV